MQAPRGRWLFKSSDLCVPLTACSDKTPAALFFRYNTQLGPPYQVGAVASDVRDTCMQVSQTTRLPAMFRWHPVAAPRRPVATAHVQSMGPWSCALALLRGSPALLFPAVPFLLPVAAVAPRTGCRSSCTPNLRATGLPATDLPAASYPIPAHGCLQVIVDTNFINFSIRNKIDLVKVSEEGQGSRGRRGRSRSGCRPALQSLVAWWRHMTAQGASGGNTGGMRGAMPDRRALSNLPPPPSRPPPHLAPPPPTHPPHPPRA